MSSSPAPYPIYLDTTRGVVDEMIELTHGQPYLLQALAPDSREPPERREVSRALMDILKNQLVVTDPPVPAARLG